jgi:small ligand-binding sensory domain FIST
MQFAAALSRRDDIQLAAQELTESIQRQIVGDVDLLTVFFTADYRHEATELAARLRYGLSPRVLLGCSCESVIAGDREIEREPAISVLAAALPDITLTPFAIPIEDWESLLTEDSGERLRRRVGAIGPSRRETRAFVVLGDPFTTPIVEFMEALDCVQPGAPTVGGMASGAAQPGGNLLLLNDEVLEDGAVGVRIAGPIRVDTIVSQGCRPVGDPLLVTRAEGNMIETFGGRPALETAREMLMHLPSDEQEMVDKGLFLGIVINEYQETFGRGDFLVRNVFGADRNTGAIVIGDSVRPGQTVQFHIRDAETADEDLRHLMAQAAEDETAPMGGLLFSCNGRGVRMFDLPNHDVRSVLDAVPETPLAGFFAAGELGPVGGKSFIHGHTLSVILFRPL